MKHKPLKCRASAVYLAANGDLRVESRFKNAALYDALEACFLAAAREQRKCGAPPVLRLASEASGVPIHTIRSLLNLQSCPYKPYSRSRNAAAKLAEAIGGSMEELFPASLYALELPGLVVHTYRSPELLSLQQAARLNISAPRTENHTAMAIDLRRSLSQLPARTRQILAMRFGLEDGQEMTLSEIAAECGLSGARIGQIKRRGLRMLRAPNLSHGLRGYIGGLDSKLK